MFKNLAPNAVGIHGLSLVDTVDLAREAGFEGVEFSVREAAQIADERGVDGLRRLFDDVGIRPGHWGLPVAWQGDEERWRAGLADLPRLAKVAAAIGCTRCATWVPPGSRERPLEENLRFHVERFRPIAEALAAHGCQLGLEFIGPKTLRDEFPYPFIHRMDQMLDLGERIGTGNVGLLLDAYHVYTSGGSIDDVRHLRPEQVVVVHVNDAVAGVPRDEQQDRVRRLPLASGVIDLAGFMRALVEIGYDGPITVEPFDEQLNALAAENPRAAAAAVAESLGGLWRAAGLG
ncbi:MAG TPA: sugar phosphate isomerase/epimerase family protein [Chloroflexota bacterium]|nr:sugar phosphate isomerase/epimerase family protein [Chloroflexota bacterium]